MGARSLLVRHYHDARRPRVCRTASHAHACDAELRPPRPRRASTPPRVPSFAAGVGGACGERLTRRGAWHHGEVCLACRRQTHPVRRRHRCGVEAGDGAGLLWDSMGGMHSTEMSDMFMPRTLTAYGSSKKGRYHDSGPAEEACMACGLFIEMSSPWWGWQWGGGVRATGGGARDAYACFASLS